MKYPNWKLACKLMRQRNTALAVKVAKQRATLAKLNRKYNVLKGTLRKERETLNETRQWDTNTTR